jgi:hypothetical protein
MIKNILVLFILSITGTNSFAQFGLYASAAYIHINGSNSFYNNTAPGLGQDIGSTNFQGTDFGIFEQNSSNLKLVGSEIKTYKGVADNVCSGTLYYTVYLAGSRPASPVFTAIDLGFYSDCFAPACGSFFGSFNLAAGGGCCSDRDQKWQNPGNGTAANIDLTTFIPGVYTLEIYYAYTGQDGGNGCITTKYDNNSNNPVNYTAGFTITTPVPVSFGNIHVTNNQTYNSITWNTYTEAQTNIFKLERSEDGMYFNPIGEIPAAGSSSTIRLYSLTDRNPVNGNNFYRVKMIETDGKYQHSATVKTTNKSQNKWYLQNNPVSDYIQLIGIEKADDIFIFNPSGAKIFSSKANGNFINIPATNMHNGIYFIKVTNNRDSKILPVLISHH